MKDKNGPTHDGKERTRNSKKDFVCVAAEKETSDAKYGVCRVWHRQQALDKTPFH